MSASLHSDQLICIGDSLTEQSWAQEGLGASLANIYSRKLDVINRGLGGYNTEWGLEAFKQARRELACGSSLRRMLTPLVGTTQYFPKKAERSFKIQLVTIWWGANDATLPGQIQHVPLDAFVQNIREMVSLIRDPASPYHSPETSIILINAPPFFQEHWLDTKAAAGGPREQDRDDEVTRQYAEAVKQLGAELGLPVADAYTAVTATNHREGLENPKAIWWDGLHLTGLAYRAVTGEVLGAIEHASPEKHWDKLPMMLPEWRLAGASDLVTGLADLAPREVRRALGDARTRARLTVATQPAALATTLAISQKADEAVEAAVAHGTDPF
ncbi:hypothetical protein BMF94_2644 [Rhodotorula taiwanensis]|uniref:SGNH hydrolase-type esterase domain-containing protein n=1 Tax=Rhodotorula taiwanensis TaxID=741276 RepID=A0A2S5BCE9_9BASI|nr:hypothetical protein BMF94_2644 [Rhodotorula taiwanensis]